MPIKQSSIGKVQTSRKYKEVNFQVQLILTSMLKRVQISSCPQQDMSNLKCICFQFRRKVVPVILQDTISLLWDSSTIQDQQEGK